MSNENNYQVGGNHYQSTTQHWDLVEQNGLGYLEGCATKYVARARKKHKSPIEDLKKAMHYCKKLQSLHLSGHRNNRRKTLLITPEEFIDNNELNDKEARVITILTFWAEASDIEDAIELIEDMLKEAQESCSTCCGTGSIKDDAHNVPALINCPDCCGG